MDIKGQYLYPRLEIQLCMMGWNYKQLAQEAKIEYKSLRRKLHGESPLQFEEAERIRDAIWRGCGSDKQIGLDKLFAATLTDY